VQLREFHHDQLVVVRLVGLCARHNVGRHGELRARPIPIKHRRYCMACSGDVAATNHQPAFPN
jgi:hypothetical protein